MKTTHDLSNLTWHVSGWTPHHWRFSGSMETGATSLADVPSIPAPVPGSVQKALLDAGLLPDWNIGLNARLCEWVENRHWIYETTIPSFWIEAGKRLTLVCDGLDYTGSVLVNGIEAGTFEGSFVPHTIPLPVPDGASNDIRLSIVFECPPRWLGQFGYTSRMTEWKPRYNYTWDWTSRLVQIGIWDAIRLEVLDGHELHDFRCTTAVADGQGTLLVQARCDAALVHLKLEREGVEVRAQDVTARELGAGVQWRQLPVDLWQPNGHGAQPLYTLTCTVSDGSGAVHDEVRRAVGFKTLRWDPCQDAPPDADPWICVVNDKPIFLQGANWTPIRPNFADLTEADYRELLTLYRNLGFNLMRVWGGGFLEKHWFYDICDELGLLVWQEFPLSSSGVDNWPPEDEASVAAMGEIGRSYIQRRSHHVSLAVWCGGNELQGGIDGNKQGIGKPCDASHPMLRRLQETVAELDPDRRFLATSSSGPLFTAEESNFGKGVHWDVHGPWGPQGSLDDAWQRYWSHDDALFRSETGSPGASPVHIIRQYLGDQQDMPANVENPYWRRTSWWIEWPEFVRELGREPETLEEYVEWSQGRQQQALAIAVKSCKDRFPRCGGIIIWMGHDSFPCAANTAIIDFHAQPKPAALAISEIFKGSAAPAAPDHS